MGRVCALLALLGAGTRIADAAIPAPKYSHEHCASLMPLDDVRRGKSAFFSDCYAHSIDTVNYPGWMVPTGCFTPGQYNPDTAPWPAETASEGYGCQTCTINSGKFAAAVFPTFWVAGTRDKMAACPEDEFDYATYHAAASVVTAASIINDQECDDGWFYNVANSRCYFKSDRYTLAASWNEANAICVKNEAALVTLTNSQENDWFVHNLLWPGTMGETFTSLWRPAESEGEDFRWHSSDFIDIPVFDGDSYRDWYPGMYANKVDPYYAAPENDLRTCMEIYPQLPKAWNPFACFVNKQYCCIKDSASIRAGRPPPSITPTPSPVSPPAIPTPAPTAVPADARYTLTVTKTGGAAANDGGWDDGFYGLEMYNAASGEWEAVDADTAAAGADEFSLLAGCYRVDTRAAGTAAASNADLLALKWSAAVAGVAAASGYGYQVKEFGVGGVICTQPALPACAQTCVSAAPAAEACGNFKLATDADCDCGDDDKLTTSALCYRAGCGTGGCGEPPKGTEVTEANVLTLSALVSGAALGEAPFAVAVQTALEAAVATVLGVEAGAVALTYIDGVAAADAFEASRRRRLAILADFEAVTAPGANGAAAMDAGILARRLVAAANQALARAADETGNLRRRLTGSRAQSRAARRRLPEGDFVRIEFDVTASDATSLEALQAAADAGTALPADAFSGVAGFEDATVIGATGESSTVPVLTESTDSSTDDSGNDDDTDGENADGNGSSGGGSSGDGGLSMGAKIGIAVGCVAAAALVAMVALGRQRKTKMAAKKPPVTAPPATDYTTNPIRAQS